MIEFSQEWTTLLKEKEWVSFNILNLYWECFEGNLEIYIGIMGFVVRIEFVVNKKRWNKFIKRMKKCMGKIQKLYERN